MASTLNETVREDGLRVVTKRLPYTKRIHLSITAKVGSAYDGDDREGYFHFNEHMAFKGTLTKSMNRVKELLGRFLVKNAFTQHSQITYMLQGSSLVEELMKELLFDLYTNPSYPSEEIEKEKGVVIREAADWKDDDVSFAFGHLSKMLWKTNPQKWQAVGTASGLKYINRDSLFAEHKKWYRPSNTIVMGVGKVDHESLVEYAFKFFPMDTGKTEHKIWDDEAEVLPEEKEFVIERKERDSATIVVGCKLPKLSLRDRRIMGLLSLMIGGGFDSLFFKEIRDRLGLCYKSNSSFDDNPLGYSFGGYTGVAPENAEQARELMLGLILRHPLEPAHFERVKTYILENMVISLESPSDWEGFLWDEVIGHGMEISRLNNFLGKSVKTFSGIAFDEVLQLRKKYLSEERFASVIVKPC